MLARSNQKFSASKKIIIRYFSTSNKKKLVILGTGWAGFKIVKDIDVDAYDVTVVSPRNHFLFTPLLTSTTVGTLEFRGVIEPIRGARNNLDYLQANAVGLDIDKQILIAESAYETREKDDQLPIKPKTEIPYDELVISVGANPNTFGTPGVEKYCFFLKQLSDARAIRNRIIECFERASSPYASQEEKKRLLHFVVIGGGPTSVEFTAELHDFLKQDVHKWYPDLENDVQITLIEAGKKLLSSFDASLSEYTMKTFKNRKVDLRTGVAVKEVQRHEMILTDGSVVPFGLGVWSTGVAPNPFVKALPFAKDKSGRILVDDHLRVLNSKNIYAAGDCAAFAIEPLPPTAQAAQQEGKFIARLLNWKAQGKEVQPFRYINRGMLAYIGGMRALIDSPSLKKGGFGSWLLWNGAYLTMLLSVKNKIMIPMYWFKSYLFGRDISRF